MFVTTAENRLKEKSGLAFPDFRNIRAAKGQRYSTTFRVSRLYERPGVWNYAAERNSRCARGLAACVVGRRFDWCARRMIARRSQQETSVVFLSSFVPWQRVCLRPINNDEICTAGGARVTFTSNKKSITRESNNYDAGVINYRRSWFTAIDYPSRCTNNRALVLLRAAGRHREAN